MIFLALIVLLSFLLLLFYDSLQHGRRLIKKIPGPRGYPLIGNTIPFILPPDKLFLYLRTVYQEYGDFNQIHAFCMQAVNIANPQDVETIMSSAKYNDKKEPYTFLKPWLSEGLLTSNGPKWHHRRKLLTKAFHFNMLKKYSKTFTEQTEVFIKKVHEETGNLKTDLLPLISSATLNIMCETAMGTSMDEGIESVTEKYFQSIHILGGAVIERICRVWLYSESLFKWTNLAKTQQKAIKELHIFTNKIIKNRKEQLKDFLYNNDTDIYDSKGKFTMLDLLLENEKSGNIDLDGIREEVDTFMFEGHDTTAVALSYFIMTIANEPTAQAKIFEEMNNIFGNSQRLPTMSDLNEMKYLDCCIKESLRLYPSVPFVARYLNEDTVLSGYKVPANTYVHILIYDLHRRPDLFTDPERFIPERFLPENCINRHPYAYIPFSAGSRNCIGQKFAILEIKTLVSSLIRKFRIEPITKPSDLRFKTDLVLRTTHPIYVQFKERK